MAESRLPVYLVLDTSASMVGEPIEAVRQGLSAMVSDLRDDPEALETVWVAVITFDDNARLLAPLTPLRMFRAPALAAGGQTSLGAGLSLLLTCLDQDRNDQAAGRDWKPLVFLMSDGAPTDAWSTPATRIRERCGDSIFACAAGSDADVAVLSALSPTVIQLSRLQPGELGSFFQWVSDEVKDAAHSPGAA